MRTTLLALTATLALTGAALAQTAVPGSAERTMNAPGSMRGNAETRMPERDLTTGTVTAPGAATRTDDLPSHSGGNATATSPTNRAR